MSNIKINGIKLSKLLQDKKGGRVKEGRGVRVRLSMIFGIFPSSEIGSQRTVHFIFG